MKILNLKNLLKSLFLATLVSLFSFSCSDDDNNTSATISESELQTSANTDEVDALLDEVSFDVFEIDNFETTSKLPPKKNNLPDCATVTKTATKTNEKTERKIEIDFGTEGCQVDEKVFKGKMIMQFVRDFSVKETTINHSFDGFSVDDIQVTGTKETMRTKENANGNRQHTRTFDVTYTWPTGEIVSRKGTKTIEHTAGSFDDSDASKNHIEFSVTGNWESMFKDGTTYSHNITTPLILKSDCKYIVSGVKEIVKNDAKSTLNYGDGTCDDKAIFTDAENVETEITLYKKDKK